MKNIFLKQFMIITVGILTVFSCDYDPTSYDALTDHAPDPSSTYYVQFKNPKGEITTGKVHQITLSPQITLKEIQNTVVVGLVGLPLSEALTVNISVDPSSTASPDMFVLGSTSLVIPAGAASASTTLTSVALNMPVDEVVTVVLRLDVGANNATAGTTATYTWLRPEICIPVTGTFRIEMHDSYGDGWQTNEGNGGNGIRVTMDGVKKEVGMCTLYQASPYEGCVEGDFYDATTYVVVPNPTGSVVWEFAGDWYGEISFEIYDPSDNLVFSRPQIRDRDGFKTLDLKVCQ